MVRVEIPHANRLEVWQELHGVRQHLNVLASGHEFLMADTLGLKLIGLNRYLAGGNWPGSHARKPRGNTTGIRTLQVDDEVGEAWTESRLGDVEKSLETELNQGELSLREEFPGKGPKQQRLKLFTGPSEVAILRSGEVRGDLEKHLERHVK